MGGVALEGRFSHVIYLTLHATQGVRLGVRRGIYTIHIRCRCGNERKGYNPARQDNPKSREADQRT